MATISESDRLLHYRLINASIAAQFIRHDGTIYPQALSYCDEANIVRDRISCFQTGNIDQGIDAKINAGFIAPTKDNHLIVSFRGTLAKELPAEVIPEGDSVCLDWSQDRKYDPIDWTVGWNHTRLGRVCQGFGEAANSVWALGIGSIIRSFEGRVEKVWITGFSKGGAMALLLASRIFHDEQWLRSILNVVTFAAPCTADNTFADSYRGMPGLIGRTVRYQTQKDVVPLIPNIETPDLTGYLPGCAGVVGTLPGRSEYHQLAGTLHFISKNNNRYTIETDQLLAEGGYLGSVTNPPPTTDEAIAAHQPQGDYLLSLEPEPRSH